MARKRRAPKSDRATQFLRNYLAEGPKPAKEVQQAASIAGISVHMLAELSQPIVDKKQQKGPDGVRRFHWSLRATPVAKESIEFKLGYERAITDMRLKITQIEDERREMSDETFAMHVCGFFRAALRSLKQKTR
jgi:hypothetical protein